MSPANPIDDDLVARLPLPLAQLYRRAHNAKTAQDRHHHAYYLAEATLKLAACVRIGIALHHGLEPRFALAQRLEQLCLPSTGQWVGMLREACDYLHTRPDASLLPLADCQEALLTHIALPAVQAFADLAAWSDADGHPPLDPQQARDASRQGILGFFNLIATYRNQVFGHGSQRVPDFYEQHGPRLLVAVREVLEQRCLFGHLTLAVAQLATDARGLVIQLLWQGMRGPVSLSLSAEAVGPEPEGDRAHAGELYFVGPGVRIPLHPLVVYLEDHNERERVGFLNRAVTRKAAGPGGAEEVRRCEYLDYNTGDQLKELLPDDVLGEVRAYDSNTGKPIGGPLLHPKSVKSIAYNSEDKIIATGGADKKVRLWDWPVPVTGDAKRVTAWVEVITGMEMDESGTVKPLDPTGWNQRKARLQALGGPPPNLPL
jgi:hypothetical protein